MAKRKKSDLPTLKKNKKNEFFINFQGKKFYMGRDSESAKKRLIQFLAEYEKNPKSKSPKKISEEKFSVAELILEFLKFLEKKKKDLSRETRSLKRVNELFGESDASAFGSLALNQVRKSWIDENLAWNYINDLVQIIKKMFRFGIEYEMVDESTYGRLALVKPLTREDAKCNPPRQEVPDAEIIKTLPYLLPTIRDMVILQRLTGMRPSEIFRMTMDQIDTSRKIWVYVPAHFKTEHFKTDRVIAWEKQKSKS